MNGSNQFTSLDEYKEYLDIVAESNKKVGDASARLLRSDKNIESVMADKSLTEQEFVEVIALCRQVSYNRAAGGANKAAENETDRLYAKNPWKFVEEFLQNADDCNYVSIPEISITIDEREKDHCSIEFCYNEEGFTRNDIWAITAFSESTKINDIVKRQAEDGVFYKEKTGRKGKGFKSVFSLSADNVIVHIRSNGFSFKLDNAIGRIMPIWEDDSKRLDGKTHVIVELIKPEFSTKEIYPEFRRLFCVDSYEGIFANSPFLFMHRLRMVQVTRITSSGEDTFITEYREDKEKTVYKQPITLTQDKEVLAGIAKDKELLNIAEYNFIRINPRLGSRIMLLGVSGSHGYGTNREGSDIDFRGVTLNLPSDLIGLTSFDQYEDSNTDTVIYSFTKIVNLLLNCNPNTIEILGLDDDQYVIKTAVGQELLDHRQLFLSKRAAASFGHYADAQLRRLQNAIARDTLPQPSREEHILKSVNHALDDFNRRQKDEYKTDAELYIDTAETEGLETEIFLDAYFRHYPLRRYNDMMNTLHTVVRDYDKIGKRNHKKDDNHLNKHAMHLVRLFMMGIDILERGEIRTHRPETDLELLRSIRNGDYMQENILTPAFYEIVTDYEQRFHEAEAHSILPDNPDMEAVGAFVEGINRRVVTGEIG